VGILDGKVAIVTGAGHGVGRGEALQLADEGAKVVINDLGGSVTGEGADKRPAEEVAELIRSRGGDAVANYDDVADFNGAKNLIAQAVDAYGTLDILVNNAGILRDRMVFSMSEEDFDSVIRVHLKGTWCTTHHASVYWREQSKAGKQPRAAIVNTVSGAGLQGQASQSNYGAAKAGIAAMTIITSLELGRYGVRVNAISPGGFTRMVGQAMDIEVKEPEQFTEYDAMNPANSAPMVAWLASDQALHVTGQIFRAVGNTIAHYTPWTLGELFENHTKDGQPAPWAVADIGPAVNAFVFGSRNPGLVLPGRK
jgi:NAD(P)-dependent dehydrogenase (short-subunit alcohol dehydrogenase family)